VKIWTYVTTDDMPPTESLRYIARIQHTDGTMHPVVFAGVDLAAVQARAEEWWTAELAKAEAASKRGSHLRRKPATTSDVPTADTMDDADLIVL